MDSNTHRPFLSPSLRIRRRSPPPTHSLDDAPHPYASADPTRWLRRPLPSSGHNDDNFGHENAAIPFDTYLPNAVATRVVKRKIEKGKTSLGTSRFTSPTSVVPSITGDFHLPPSTTSRKEKEEGRGKNAISVSPFHYDASTYCPSYHPQHPHLTHDRKGEEDEKCNMRGGSAVDPAVALSQKEGEGWSRRSSAVLVRSALAPVADARPHRFSSLDAAQRFTSSSVHKFRSPTTALLPQEPRSCRHSLSSCSCYSSPSLRPSTSSNPNRYAKIDFSSGVGDESGSAEGVKQKPQQQEEQQVEKGEEEDISRARCHADTKKAKENLNHHHDFNHNNNNRLEDGDGDNELEEAARRLMRHLGYSSSTSSFSSPASSLEHADVPHPFITKMTETPSPEEVKPFPFFSSAIVPPRIHCSTTTTTTTASSSLLANAKKGKLVDMQEEEEQVQMYEQKQDEEEEAEHRSSVLEKPEESCKKEKRTRRVQWWDSLGKQEREKQKKVEIMEKYDRDEDCQEEEPQNLHSTCAMPCNVLAFFTSSEPPPSPPPSSSSSSFSHDEEEKEGNDFQPHIRRSSFALVPYSDWISHPHDSTSNNTRDGGSQHKKGSTWRADVERAEDSDTDRATVEVASRPPVRSPPLPSHSIFLTVSSSRSSLTDSSPSPEASFLFSSSALPPPYTCLPLVKSLYDTRDGSDLGGEKKKRKSTKITSPRVPGNHHLALDVFTQRATIPSPLPPFSCSSFFSSVVPPSFSFPKAAAMHANKSYAFGGGGGAPEEQVKKTIQRLQQAQRDYSRPFFLYRHSHRQTTMETEEG